MDQENVSFTDKKSITYHLFKFLFTLIFAVAGTFTAAFYVDQGRVLLLDKLTTYYKEVLEKITYIKVVKEYVKISERDLTDIIADVSKEFNLNPVILKAVVAQESSGQFLYRFEPRVFDSRKNADRYTTEDERRMLASSHGLTQVMGYNAEARCNIHWSKLYDEYNSLRCAAIIIRENLNNVKHVSNSSEKLRLALKAYNGSGDMAEAYSQKIMAKIGELLLKDSVS